MTNSHTLIIGAGAAGLMTAYRLVKAGKKVTILEARNRIGGRIYTLDESVFPGAVEAGAEFIHGDLPVTLHILKEAGIAATPAGGAMWQYEDGKLTEESNFIEGWSLLMQRLEELEHDITISTFLNTCFPGDEYQKMRDSVNRFVSGYDNADPALASCFALRREWQSEDEEAQHRVAGGYSALMEFLLNAVKEAGGELFLNTAVKEIHWERGSVRAITTEDIVFAADKIVLCVPLGVLQLPAGEEGNISFKPQIPLHTTAIHQLGFGAVIKILLLFKQPFWLDKSNKRLAGKDMSNMGYLLSEEEIPTWWTQTPNQSNLFTGWVGGLKAGAHKTTADKDLLQWSLQSLSQIFGLSIEQLKEQLVQWTIANWTAEPYTLGGYAYDTTGSDAARKMLAQPVSDTIYFAGEYLYDGAAMGTVEAALSSGKLVAKQIVISSD